MSLTQCIGMKGVFILSDIKYFTTDSVGGGRIPAKCVGSLGTDSLH